MSKFKYAVIQQYYGESAEQNNLIHYYIKSDRELLSNEKQSIAYGILHYAVTGDTFLPPYVSLSSIFKKNFNDYSIRASENGAYCSISNLGQEETSYLIKVVDVTNLYGIHFTNKVLNEKYDISDFLDMHTTQSSFEKAVLRSFKSVDEDDFDLKLFHSMIDTYQISYKDEGKSYINTFIVIDQKA